MVKPQLPDLKKYMEKELIIQLNGSRKVRGVLRGYDAFMNIVMDDLYELRPGGEGDDGEQRIPLGSSVIRGNSIVIIEAAEAI